MKREVHGVLQNGERVYLGYLVDDDELSVSTEILEGFAYGSKWFNLGSFIYRYENFAGIQITPQYNTKAKKE